MGGTPWLKVHTTVFKHFGLSQSGWEAAAAAFDRVAVRSS